MEIIVFDLKVTSAAEPGVDGSGNRVGFRDTSRITGFSFFWVERAQGAVVQRGTASFPGRLHDKGDWVFSTDIELSEENLRNLEKAFFDSRASVDWCEINKIEEDLLLDYERERGDGWRRVSDEIRVTS